jgi:hypothetical protein
VLLGVLVDVELTPFVAFGLCCTQVSNISNAAIWFANIANP